MKSFMNQLLLCLCLVATSSASLLEKHTFQTPFDYIEPNGNRGVSKDFKTGGVASVSTNFLRLTPDRQSKRGAVWSRKPLGVSSFSSTLEFRISGQGKKFFGDGMALWFMQQAYYVEGDFHGTAEKFTGFGVILDTFKNTETLAFHKDVSIVYNDGKQTVEAMMENKQGCDANIRYHEDRGDFSVQSASRLKVVLTNGRTVSISVDAKNDGNFVTCASMELPFEEDWAEKAYVGVTASTGQLADNHDVLSLVTFSDAKKHDQYIEQSAMKPAFERGLGFNMERFERLEDKVSEMQETIDYLHHKLEHELASIEDHIKITTGKLQAQEAISEGRIDELEQKIKGSISNDVSGKLSQLSSNMDEQVMDRIRMVEEGMKQKITESMDGVEGLGGGWKLPFFILFFMMCLGGFALFKWYQQLKKTHML